MGGTRGAGPLRRLCRLLLVCVALLGAGDVRGEEAGDASLLAACDAEDAARLDFLERHLADRATYARRWWNGWNFVFGAGIEMQSTRAALVDDRGKRAQRIASAVQSTIGLTRNLWSPPHAKQGIRELAHLPLDDPGGCTARRERAEALLERNAEQAVKERWGWRPHAGNLALNLAAAAVVYGMYDYEGALWNAALGIAVGEIRIWSYPWHAEDDWKNYQARFPADAPRQSQERLGWSLAPWHQGLRITVRY